MAYTNSPLVTYTKLSSNHSGQRTHSIDRITPHCVVGQATAERIAEIFTPTSRQASCNYGIGFDGRISLVVEEKNRSWCASSKENDQRAITIEVASDSTTPYAFRDAAYAALISLCVDICKRNGKKKLIWFGDKAKTLAYNPASDEMILSVHRWFANKSCPGDWMYARMGELAAKVTAQLSGTTTQETSQDNGQDDVKVIWDRLYAAIQNPYGTAGLVGNLYAESALNPQNLQNNGNTKLGMTDAEFTAAVDNGSYSADTFIHDGYGYGLAQWTFRTRKEALLNYAKEKKTSIGDLSMQLAFLIDEIKGYKTVWNTLVNAKTVKEASDAVLTGYEKPADQSDAVKVKRAGYGQTYLEKYGVTPSTSTVYYRVRKKDNSAASQIGAFSVYANAKACADLNPGYYVFLDGKIVYPVKEENTDVPFRVKVSIDDLNIRKGAGTNYAKTGKYTGKGVFTITEVLPGKGSTAGWGRLKSGAGFISLDYCQRL